MILRLPEGNAQVMPGLVLLGKLRQGVMCYLGSSKLSDTRALFA